MIQTILKAANEVISKPKLDVQIISLLLDERIRLRLLARIYVYCINYLSILGWSALFLD
jgi:hypothetical protein